MSDRPDVCREAPNARPEQHAGPFHGFTISKSHSESLLNQNGILAKPCRVSKLAQLCTRQADWTAVLLFRSDIFAITFQLAEVAVTGPMVRAVIAAIRRLRAQPLCA